MTSTTTSTTTTSSSGAMGPGMSPMTMTSTPSGQSSQVQQQQQQQQQQTQQQPLPPHSGDSRFENGPPRPPGGPASGVPAPGSGLQQNQNSPTTLPQTMSNTVQADKSESSNPTTGTKSVYLIRLLLKLEIKIMLFEL